LLQKGQIFRLTRDDTYVQELVDAGKLDPIDALQHPQRNVLSKALGTSASRTVAVYESELELGSDDILMLCTDGLYEYFSQQEILELLSEMPFRDVGQRMIALAKERGGHDNLSLLLVRKAPEVLTGQQPTQTQKIELS
jgi:protein phosphatase